MKDVFMFFRRQPLGFVALILVLSGGGAYAASAAWTGDNIVDGSLTGADVANGSLTGADIQDGSLTAADVNGIGATTPVLDWMAPGPISFGPAVSPPATVTEVPFTVATDGFYELQGKGTLTAVGTVCDGFFNSGLAQWRVDSSPSYSAAGVGVQAGSSPPNVASDVLVWLSAGQHHAQITGTSFCEGTVGSGSYELTGVRLVVKAA